MLSRRGFLGAILAAGVAPAIVRADALMRIVPRDTTVLSGAGVLNCFPWKQGCVYVSDKGDDANDGLTWATAKRSVAEAMALVDVGGTLYVGNQYVYGETFNAREGRTICLAGAPEGHQVIRSCNFLTDTPGASRVLLRD